MLRRRDILTGGAMLAVALAAFPGTGLADGRGPAAQRFIESLADKAIAALTVPSISRDERVTRFRRLLGEHFAVKTIGRWVLGRYWNAATAAEREEFLHLFEDLIVATYVDRFTNYSGETLTILKTVAASDVDALVYSRITRPAGGDPINVTWRVRGEDTNLKIVDVMVEGISMGLTQRSEFGSVLRRNGGTIEGLLATLRKDFRKDA